MKKRGRKKKKEHLAKSDKMEEETSTVRIQKEEAEEEENKEQAEEPTNCPPSERKVTSYVNTLSSTKNIPRLVDTNGGQTADMGELCPREWNVFDVAQFLRVNDCTNYCDSFSKQVIIVFRDKIYFVVVINVVTL